MGRCLVLLFAGFLLIVSATVLAQTTGDVEGKLTDLSGAGLPGVTVEARSPSLQGTRIAVSNRDGARRRPRSPG